MFLKLRSNSAPANGRRPAAVDLFTRAHRLIAAELKPCRPLCTSFALRTPRTDRSLRARRAGFATLAGGALRTNGTSRPLCALRSGLAGLVGYERKGGQPLLEDGGFAQPRERRAAICHARSSDRAGLVRDRGDR
jgi:hypothetical protein